MNRLLSLLMTLLLLTTALSGCTQAQQTQDDEPAPESVEINFFYNEPCGACHDQINDFYDFFGEELADVKDLYPYELNAYNVFQDSDEEKMNETLEALGYTEEIIHTLTFPIMTCNGKVYLGIDSIEDSLREAYLTAGEDLFVYDRGVYDPLKEETLAQQLEDYPLDKGSASIVYFHRLTCEECIQTEEDFLNSLPETITVDGKEYPLQMVTINTRSGSNGDILQAFFDTYQVPEEDQMVPIIFIAQGYLAGYEDITENLLSELEAGAGLNFQYPTGE